MSTSLLNLLFAQIIYKQMLEERSAFENGVGHDQFVKLSKALEAHPLNVEFRLSPEACKALYGALLPEKSTSLTTAALEQLLSKLYETYKQDTISSIKSDEAKLKALGEASEANETVAEDEEEADKMDVDEVAPEVVKEEEREESRPEAEVEKPETPQKETEEPAESSKPEEKAEDKADEQAEDSAEPEEPEETGAADESEVSEAKADHAAPQDTAKDQEPSQDGDKYHDNDQGEAQSQDQEASVSVPGKPDTEPSEQREQAEQDEDKEDEADEDKRQTADENASAEPEPEPEPKTRSAKEDPPRRSSRRMTRRAQAAAEAEEAKAAAEQSEDDAGAEEDDAGTKDAKVKNENETPEATATPDKTPKPEPTPARESREGTTDMQDGTPADEQESEGGSEDEDDGSETEEGSRKRKRKSAPPSASLRRFQQMVNPLLSDILSNKSASFFAHPVNPNDAPAYYDLVLSPTDLRTIKTAVKEGTIHDTNELERELQLMFANAIMYNDWDTNMSMWAREMQRDTERIITLFRSAERGSTPVDETETKRRKK